MAVAVVAYLTTLQPGSLGLKVGLCQGAPCISWVMPGGQAWDEGARPGMPVLKLDDFTLSEDNADAFLTAEIHDIVLQTSDGGILTITRQGEAISQYPMKFSLWVIGGMFALLSSAVLIRRPDLHAARMFGLFSVFTSLALAIGPSAGGPSPPWAIVVQFLTFAGVGASFLPFVVALMGEAPSWYGKIVRPVVVGVGLAIIAGFLVSVLELPALYQMVRPSLFLYVSACVLAGGFLVIRETRHTSVLRRQQARIILWGIVLSTFPFVVLTLVPEALGAEAIVLEHITVVAWGLLPAFFSYAILHYQLLGIRRLVHRGMVYSLTTVGLMVIITIIWAALLAAVNGASGANQGYIVPAMVVGGILLFSALRLVMRWLVDRFIYRDIIDYHTFIEVVREDLLASRRTDNVATGMAQRLAQALRLESALLFLGEEPRTAQLVAAVGERAEHILKHLHPHLQVYIQGPRDRYLVELHWESDFLLLAHLAVGGKYLGYLLLGPKHAGEAFVEEERRLVAMILPILALAIDKSELSEELRALNRRLIRAGEAERARISSDLHDGPLQKAMLLAGVAGASVEDSSGLARQLASELREICSRLRPAILDDLGVVPALEWLLEGVSRRSGISTSLELNNLHEEERLPPDVELAIFRVTQEAANNSLKHASATALEVSLSREFHTIVLKVVDNGVGFSIPSRGVAGFGISGMRERVMQLDGSFEIYSAPGRGTTVVARIPAVEEPAGEDTYEASAEAESPHR